MTQELPEGTVTILFTDVVGSTLLSNTRGDVAAQEIMRSQRDIVRQQLKEHSGYEVKGTGDGFMVAFQSARRAIGCAIGIQRAIEQQNTSRPADQRALVRIGVNSGEVIREDDDLFGTAVNAAARVASKAEGGQILVSETVKALVGSARDLKFHRQGPLPPQGLPGTLAAVRGRLAKRGANECSPHARRTNAVRWPHRRARGAARNPDESDRRSRESGVNRW